MMQRFIAAFTTILLTGLIAACTDPGSNVAAKTARGIEGQWKSESITRQGTTTAKFNGDGTCYFRESGGEQVSCKWTEPGQGQTKIIITFPGRGDVSFASAEGDRLFVNEPARETVFIRDEVQFLGASVRQLLTGRATQ